LSKFINDISLGDAVSNNERVQTEIRSAVERLSITGFPPETIANAAIDCVHITIQHSQLQTNVNQQFDQLLRKLGASLLRNEGVE